MLSIERNFLRFFSTRFQHFDWNKIKMKKLHTHTKERHIQPACRCVYKICLKEEIKRTCTVQKKKTKSAQKPIDMASYVDGQHVAGHVSFCATNENHTYIQIGADRLSTFNVWWPKTKKKMKRKYVVAVCICKSLTHTTFVVRMWKKTVDTKYKSHFQPFHLFSSSSSLF